MELIAEGYDKWHNHISIAETHNHGVPYYVMSVNGNEYKSYDPEDAASLYKNIVEGK